MLHADRPSLALPSPTDFPPKIQAALGRLAGRVGLCSQVSPQCRLLLAELLRCLDYKNPLESIRIKNTSLATALGLSVRTVGALKAKLEEQGWIRRHQVQSRRRGMQVADIWLTRLALEALGFGMGVTGVDNRGVRNPQAQPMRRQSNTHAYLFPQPSSKGHQAKPGEVEVINETPLSPSELEYLREMQAVYGENLERMEEAEDIHCNGPAAMVSANTQTKVPQDLQLLLSLGLSESAVFKLMGLATRMKCRLSHVVAVAGKSIAKADRVYCYVLKLLKSKKDWASLAALPSGAAPIVTSHATAAERPGISAAEAQQLAGEAHARIGCGCLVDTEDGRAWYVEDGVISEMPLDLLAHADSVETALGGTSACQGVTSLTPWMPFGATDRNAYERLGRRLVRQSLDGRLFRCTREEAKQLAERRANELRDMQAAVRPGMVVLNRTACLAWRYHLGRFEQATLREGGRLQWALQISAGAEKGVARDLSKGLAIVLPESEVSTVTGPASPTAPIAKAEHWSAVSPLSALKALGFSAA